MNKKEISDSDNNIFKLVRVARGYSAKDLAKELQVSQSYIHAIESGEKLPSGSLYQKYLDALGINDSIVYMFDKQSKKCDSYEKLLLCLLKMLCK